MKFKRTQLYGAAALGLCALAVVALIARAIPVEIVAVYQGEMLQSVVTSGRIANVARTEVASQNTALIESILVREGVQVQAGEVLVRLRDDEAQASLRQAEAAVSEAHLRLRQIQTIQGPVSEQQLAQARATDQQAQQELTRSQALLQQGFVSPSRLDDVLRAANTSRAALLSASAQAQGYQAGGVEVALVQARLEQAQAAKNAALARLAQLVLRAPATALVITRAADPGDMAQAGRSILTLVGGGETRIHASVDEKNLKFLRLGQSARASADAYPERPFAAQLTYIAPAVDPQRGSVDLKLRVDPPVDDLRPDMTVSVEIVTARVADALMLPTDALRRDANGGLFVLREHNGHAQKVIVQAGLQGIGTTQITQGLAVGERVILPGSTASEGDRVRVQSVRTPLGNAQPQPGLKN